MAVRPKLDPELQKVIDRTRAQMAAYGELKAATGAFVSPFDEETKDVIVEFIRSGEFRKAVEEIGHEDPDLADM